MMKGSGSASVPLTIRIREAPKLTDPDPEHCAGELCGLELCGLERCGIELCGEACNLMETGLQGHVELLETLWRRTGRNETLCRRTC
jgi:hypothetical protein